MTRISGNSNVSAFLDTIARSEGTPQIPGSDDGYNVLVGGKLFHSYTDHPRIVVDLGRGLRSTAAGRYQILSRYFDHYKESLGLPDFGPESQDKIALRQIVESHALSDVVAGRFDSAIQKCAHIWASLPGAGYGQHERDLAWLRDHYIAAGGELA